MVVAVKLPFKPLLADVATLLSTTLPASLILNTFVPADVLTDRAAGRRSGETSFALLLNAVSTVRDVSDAIAVTVLVSPVTRMRSPTTSSVKNLVPTPGTVVEAAGSIVPVRILVRLALIRLELDCRIWDGVS